MKIHTQIISKDGVPEYVVLPYEDYKHILELLEDIEDAESVEKALRSTKERFPLEIVHSIALGENPIKVFREYRKLTQTELANKSKVSKQYISQIESTERKGSIKVLKAIAKSLNVDLDDLII
jgi:DNA-binding XRE family transcriptional regulator